MANDLAQIAKSVFKEFNETLVNATESFSAVGPILTDDRPNLEMQMSQSTGGLTAYSAVGTSVNKDIKSANVVHSSTGYAKTEKITWKDRRDNPDLPARRARIMANEGAAHIQDTFFTGLASLFATAHPMAGANSWEVGAGKMYIDNALTYNGGTQSNLSADALSRVALVNSDITIANWRRVGSGQKLNLGNSMGQKVLVCSPDNKDLAIELLRSQVKDADMQANSMFQWAAPVFYPLTAAQDWFVVHRGIGEMGGPVAMWIRETPQIDLSWDSGSGNLDLVMSVRLIADFVYDVEGAGIVGYNAP